MLKSKIILVSFLFVFNILNSFSQKNNQRDSIVEYKHEIGEFFEVGVIFKLWKDSLGNEHGLVVSLTDVSTGMEWSNLFYKEVGDSAKNNENGKINTKCIVFQPGHKSSAALVCDKLIQSGKSDWYLPTYFEFCVIIENISIINNELKKIKRANFINSKGLYWTSTEYDLKHAFTISYNHGNYAMIVCEFMTEGAMKYQCNSVRAIRAF